LSSASLTAIIESSNGKEALVVEINLTSMPIGETRVLLATGAPVYLFANPVEYHGPHLSLENDGLVSRGLARDLHARLQETHPDWPFLVTADLGMGCAVVPGPGSRQTSFIHQRKQVLETCYALAAMGASRVILMTFHGDPLHLLALQAGVRALAARKIAALSPMNLLVRRIVGLQTGDPQMSEVLGAIQDPQNRRAMAEEMHTDVHAGFGETSLSLHYAPLSVSPCYRNLPPCPRWQPIPALTAMSRAARLAGAQTLADETAYVAQLLGWMGLRPFPGYTGRPSLANAEAGARLGRIIVDGMVKACQDVFEFGAAPPEPVMPWLTTVTLQGRFY
jgi:creatinine amidohydrolase